VGALQRPKKALFAKLIAGIGYFAFAQKSFENAVIGIEFAARFSSNVYNACDDGSVRQESSGRPAKKAGFLGNRASSDSPLRLSKSQPFSL
jgi:hypothetical protein